MTKRVAHVFTDEHRRESSGARRWTQAAGVVLLACALAVLMLAPRYGAAAPLPMPQQPNPNSTTGGPEPNVEHILGFPHIKHHFMGALTVQGDSLVVAWEKTKSSIKISQIDDLFTGADSQQLFHGTAGTVIKTGVPYEGGRVLSLFSQSTEVLTVEFHDANGGFHGAIFVLPKGHATELKKLLVAAGAHASIAPDAAAPQK